MAKPQVVEAVVAGPMKTTKAAVAVAVAVISG